MNPFKGRHFERHIILWAVRWYCKYGISYRELQEMLAERGVNVDVKVNGRWAYLYAVDSRGCTINFYLSSRRHTKAAYRFMGKLLNNCRYRCKTGPPADVNLTHPG